MGEIKFGLFWKNFQNGLYISGLEQTVLLPVIEEHSKATVD